MLFFWLYGINSYTGLLIYTALFQFTSTVFWTLYITFAYDIAEIDAYKHGKRREGSLVALVSFAQKLGSAVGMYLTGFLLTALGYDASLAVQPAAAIDGMNMLCTLPPAISIILSIIIMSRYPVTKDNYGALTEALRDKEEGKEYSEEGFKKLL